MELRFLREVERVGEFALTLIVQLKCFVTCQHQEILEERNAARALRELIGSSFGQQTKQLWTR
jgi:hypothetical protein